MAGGRIGPSAPVDPNAPSVLRVRADCGGRLFTAKLGVVVHYRRIKCSITCWRMMPSCWLVSSATVFAIALITSSASSVSTLSEPACPIPCGPQEPVHVGVEVGITPGRMKRWRDRHRAHTLPRDPVSACLPPTPLHRCIGLRVRSLNDPHDARLRPFNRHTLEPAAASRCEPTHPSSSAC